ncbi:hypothetical protein KCU77_g22, partial [Aureobasidium melanogenum]
MPNLVTPMTKGDDPAPLAPENTKNVKDDQSVNDAAEHTRHHTPRILCLASCQSDKKPRNRPVDPLTMYSANEPGLSQKIRVPKAFNASMEDVIIATQTPRTSLYVYAPLLIDWSQYPIREQTAEISLATIRALLTV